MDNIVDSGDGVRRVFQGWSGGGRPSESTGNYVYAFTPQVLKASWATYYRLDVVSSVDDAVVLGSGWYPEGKVVKIEAQREVIVDDWTRERFSHWTVVEGDLIFDDPEDSMQLVTMGSPVTVRADYDTYYRVEVLSPHGSPSGSGFHRSGDVVLISVESPYTSSDGVRYVFQSWKGDVSSRINPVRVTVEGPMMVEAVWGTEYKVSIASEVPSVGGMVSCWWHRNYRGPR